MLPIEVFFTTTNWNGREALRPTFYVPPPPPPYRGARQVEERGVEKMAAGQLSAPPPPPPPYNSSTPDILDSPNSTPGATILNNLADVLFASFYSSGESHEEAAAAASSSVYSASSSSFNDIYMSSLPAAVATVPCSSTANDIFPENVQKNSPPPPPPPYVPPISSSPPPSPPAECYEYEKITPAYLEWLSAYVDKEMASIE